MDLKKLRRGITQMQDRRLEDLGEDFFSIFNVTGVFPEKEKTRIEFDIVGNKISVTGQYKGEQGMVYSSLNGRVYSLEEFMDHLFLSAPVEHQKKYVIPFVYFTKMHPSLFKTVFVGAIEQKMAEALAKKLSAFVSRRKASFMSEDSRTGRIDVEYSIGKETNYYTINYFFSPKGYQLNMIDRRMNHLLLDKHNRTFELFSEQIREKTQEKEFHLDYYTFGSPQKIFLEVLKTIIRDSKEYKLKKMFDLNIKIL